MNELNFQIPRKEKAYCNLARQDQLNQISSEITEKKIKVETRLVVDFESEDNAWKLAEYRSKDIFLQCAVPFFMASKLTKIQKPTFNLSSKAFVSLQLEQ
ncbi:hypothetical protein J1605_012078 [Eschrichtius robustus]|uniref:Uncharacterized protein n=1 Tax=Eschrichtius robustus TaxID=9764 RepID=A0AB34GLD2_ESCRO|nr:hypothetical protein J1605_012078 [Eschrichtius robustus]